MPPTSKFSLTPSPPRILDLFHVNFFDAPRGPLSPWTRPQFLNYPRILGLAHELWCITLFLVLFQFQKCLEELWKSGKSSNSQSSGTDSARQIVLARSTRAISVVSAVGMSNVVSSQV